MKRRVQNFEGQILVASPAHTNIFARSLVLITHHEAEGTLGLIFNKPTAQTLGDLLREKQKTLVQTRVYNGGPVERDILSILGICFEGKKLTLKTHLTPEDAEAFLHEHPRNSQLRAYQGYAGWDVGQLEGEIERGDWTLVPLTPAFLEPIAPDTLWVWAAQS